MAETYDGILNDVGAMPLRFEDVIRSIEAAMAQEEGKKIAVEEGCTGGGTGMISQGFKAGTGSASRVVEGSDAKGAGEGTKVEYTVGTLVQANYGAKRDLRIGGVPVGRLMMEEDEAKAKVEETEMAKLAKDGSIIVVIATSAPLHPTQLHRLAKRATVGLSRVGGWGSNSSGDIFLAFSTAAEIPRAPNPSWEATVGQSVDVVQDVTINALFECAADATEEAICNALCMAEDAQGPQGLGVKAIGLARLKWSEPPGLSSWTINSATCPIVAGVSGFPGLLL